MSLPLGWGVTYRTLGAPEGWLRQPPLAAAVTKREFK